MKAWILIIFLTNGSTVSAETSSKAECEALYRAMSQMLVNQVERHTCERKK